MKINNREIKMIIFDLDGTLLASCHIWKEVDKHFFERRNIPMPEDYGKIIAPLGFDKASEYTKTTFNLEESCEDIMKEWNDEVIDLYRNDIILKPKAREFLDLAKSKGAILNVATANQEECYMPCLIRNKIDMYFEHIIDVKEFKEGKNSPAIYLEIAKRYDMDPKDIMVIEDISRGLKNAKKAGFLTCGIYEETSGEEELKKEISDIYIHDFDELISLVS